MVRWKWYLEEMCRPIFVVVYNAQLHCGIWSWLDEDIWVILYGNNAFRNPEVGPVRKNGRSYRHHTAALPQPLGEKPGSLIHVEVSPGSHIRMHICVNHPSTHVLLESSPKRQHDSSEWRSSPTESGSSLRWWTARTVRFGAWEGGAPSPRTATLARPAPSAAPPTKPVSPKPTRQVLYLESHRGHRNMCYTYSNRWAAQSYSSYIYI